MTPRRTWREERIDAFDCCGVGVRDVDVKGCGELIDERVKFVASQMRVSTATSPRLPDGRGHQGLAQTMAFSFVEETPGADLVSAPRDAAIPIRLAGRVSAGLAEAVWIRLAEREDLQYTREAVAHLAHAQGVLGLIMSDQIDEDIDGEPWVRVPRALLHRLARYLEAAAALVAEGVVGYDVDPAETRGLPEALRRDAGLLRTITDPQ